VLPSFERGSSAPADEAAVTLEDSDEKRQIEERHESDEPVQLVLLLLVLGSEILKILPGFLRSLAHIVDVVIGPLKLLSLRGQLGHDGVGRRLRLVVRFDCVRKDASLLVGECLAGRTAILIRIEAVVQTVAIWG